MKKILLLLALSFVLFSCEKAHHLKNIGIDQISVSECKASKGILNDSLKYKTVDTNYLSITHVNSYFNCDPGQLTVDIKTRNDTIIINEAEEDGSANCICPYDFNFRIGPLDYGIYNIKLTRGGAPYISFLVDFTSTTNRSFLIFHPDK